jgi:hypothetical protein
MAALPLALLSSCSAASAMPEVCQPKEGLHQHQPQYHIIAPMEP